MNDYRQAYGEWMESGLFDEETRREVAALRDEREIEDRFYRELDFGTGGLRGILGAGTNRMIALHPPRDIEQCYDQRKGSLVDDVNREPRVEEGKLSKPAAQDLAEVRVVDIAVLPQR